MAKTMLTVTIGKNAHFSIPLLKQCIYSEKYASLLKYQGFCLVAFQ